MALNMDEHVSTLILSGMTTDVSTGNTINQNCAQGLALAQTYLLVEHAGASDDATILAGIQAASRSPGGTTS